ncbi:acid protease [Coniochaeta ligniaria NRRL 30616]|uniref:Acid protease n=1 Tax=Coniochaeta ligniaria NRRL 30616 TaxID=1408157 RepID=A0A1J7JEC5_9PEZI|nr:acid protease [Coniochaeta ligniaria NRRL 30616]
MVASHTLMMQAVWLCVFLFLSLVHGHPASPAFDLSSIKRDNTGSFAIGASRNPNVQRSGPRAKLRALAKYGLPIPDSLAEFASDKGLIGDVAAYNQTEDREWLSPVSIGTPGQEVLLDFDTGSSDLWVFSSETKTRGAINGSRQIWSPHLSSSARQVNGSRWQIMYGDGSYASGSVWKDTILLGNITIPDVIVESAVTVSRSMVTDTVLSGLLGLAYSLPSQVYPVAPTFLDVLTPVLDAPVFTVDLHWHTDGLYEFGRIDTTKYTGEMFYTPVTNNSKYWGFTFTGYNIGPSVEWLESEWAAIVDTGTTLILLQDDLVKLYYDNATDAGAAYNSTVDGYTYLCNATLPDLHMGFENGYYVTIPGKYLNYTDMAELGQPDMCYGALQSVGALPFSILGDVFLKAVYAVFDIGKGQIGLADKTLN